MFKLQNLKFLIAAILVPLNVNFMFSELQLRIFFIYIDNFIT